jgi:hypothetical protein
MSELVFDDYFKKFVLKCYDSVPIRWKQVLGKEGGVIKY